MTKGRYGVSFLISGIIYTLLGLFIIHFINIPKILKEEKEKPIKISIITPNIHQKSIIPKKPKIEKPKIKKPKPKKPIIREIKSHKPKIEKPKIREIKPKKIVKKATIIKATPIIKPKEDIIPKEPKPIIYHEPIYKEIEPEPIIYNEPIYKEVESEPIIHNEPIYQEIEPEPIYQSSIIPDEVYTHSSIVDDTPPPQQIIEEYTPAPIEEIYTPPTYSEPQIVAPPPPPIYETPFQPAPQQQNNDGAKRAFLNNLRSQIIANKEYPIKAKRRHIQGSVEVMFDLSLDGTATNIRFISGKSILQKGVKKAILRSFPISIPNEIENQLPMYNISITVNFYIE